MKLSLLWPSVLVFAGACNAQYFSAGWKPGQEVPKAEQTSSGFSPQATATGANPGEKKSFFDFSTLLETGPIAGLFNRAGINITERLAQVREQQAKIWDMRVPFIHDDNYVDLLINEPMTPEEEEKRVWFLVVTITSAQPDGISKYVDQQYDMAYNLTQEHNDLPDVRWGRIDYMNVTALTTKWGIWRAPFLVVATDRAQTLRFYRAHQLRLNAEIMREFLKAEGWRQSKPWKSNFAPGGSREFILDWLAVWCTKYNSIMSVVPRWAFILISGTVASALVNVLHNNPFSRKRAPEAPAPSAKKDEGAVAQATPATTKPATAQASGSKQTNAKQRKSGKK